MSRTARSAIGEALASPRAPKLVVVNQSTSEGRFSLMFRVRPTLLKELREMTLGPSYIVIEYAIQKLLEDLKEQPQGTLLTLNAEDFNPTPADAEAMEQLPRMRKNKARAKKAKEANDDAASES